MQKHDLNQTIIQWLEKEHKFPKQKVHSPDNYEYEYIRGHNPCEEIYLDNNTLVTHFTSPDYKRTISIAYDNNYLDFGLFDNDLSTRHTYGKGGHTNLISIILHYSDPEFFNKLTTFITENNIKSLKPSGVTRGTES